MKWIGQHIYDLVSRFRNAVYISETLTIGSATDIEPKINLLNDENSVEIGIANATNDMVAGSADGDLVINSVGDHKIILAQNDAEVITIESDTQVSFANNILVNGNMVDISGSTSVGARVRFYEGTDNGTNEVTLNAPAAIGTSFNLILPDDVGSNGQFLQTDGNSDAAMSWATPDHDALTNFAANEHYTQANIVATGTIASGVWNGTAVASAYLDTDTAHLHTTQTFTGDKTFEGKCTVNSRVYALPATSDGDHAAGDVAYFGGTTSMTAGKCYYFTAGGVWALSNGGADATATGLLAIALGAASDVDGMLLRGMVTPYSPAGSDDEGKKLYLRVQDGTITTAIPTSSGNFVRIVGYMLHASNDAIYFCPDNSYVEVA